MLSYRSVPRKEGFSLRQHVQSGKNTLGFCILGFSYDARTGPSILARIIHDDAKPRRSRYRPKTQCLWGVCETLGFNVNWVEFEPTSLLPAPAARLHPLTGHYYEYLPPSPSRPSPCWGCWGGAGDGGEGDGSPV